MSRSLDREIYLELEVPPFAVLAPSADQYREPCLRLFECLPSRTAFSKGSRLFEEEMLFYQCLAHPLSGCLSKVLASMHCWETIKSSDRGTRILIVRGDSEIEAY